jgi:hypothetical protein
VEVLTSKSLATLAIPNLIELSFNCFNAEAPISVRL